MPELEQTRALAPWRVTVMSTMLSALWNNDDCRGTKNRYSSTIIFWRRYSQPAAVHNRRLGGRHQRELTVLLLFAVEGSWEKQERIRKAGIFGGSTDAMSFAMHESWGRVGNGAKADSADSGYYWTAHICNNYVCYSRPSSMTPADTHRVTAKQWNGKSRNTQVNAKDRCWPRCSSWHEGENSERPADPQSRWSCTNYGVCEYVCIYECVCIYVY